MKSHHFAEQFQLPAYNLTPQKVTKFLLSLIALLILGNLTERAIVYWFNAQNGTQAISKYFNFDQESNFPSLYSALSLCLSSYILGIIATIKKARKSQYARHWKALAWIFLFLGVDEACSIHEMSIPFLRGAFNGSGILYFTWVIPAFILLIVFLLVYRKFVLSLPAKTKMLFIIAGLMYVGGALGMELLGGYLADTSGYNTAYGIASSVEEILEMLGIVVFIHGLLGYIQSQLKELHISLSFDEQLNSKTRF